MGAIHLKYSYAWYTAKEQEKREKKRSTCKHIRTIHVCLDCKMHLETGKEFKRPPGAKKIII